MIFKLAMRDKNVPPIRLKQGRGRTTVTLRARRIGEDWLVEIGGGVCHIGAVALAPFNPRRKCSVVKLLTVARHKEGAIAKHAAKAISQATRSTCVGVVGIHVDGITKGEIRRIQISCKKLVQRAVKRIREGKGFIAKIR